MTDRQLYAALGLICACAAPFACGDDSVPSQPIPADGGTIEQADGATVPSGTPDRLSRPSHGSAMDISEDDALLVVANRGVGTVSVFDVAYGANAPPKLTKKAEVPACGEPSQVVLAPGADSAFVVCRKDQKVVRLDALRTAPVKGREVTVGSEPTGIALTPNGTSAWVANWMDGTVTEVDVEKMTVTTTVDLNAALVATGALGNVAARPALAHPRSVAITNNRDGLEDDESLLVTEYFAQQKEALAANGANADTAKQGYVYRVSLKDKAVRTIALPPIANIGIHDHADGIAGCYPNQLQAINVQGSFAYVLSICASPRGPLGDFTGPSKAACSDDTTCPGGAAGACNLATSTCKTNCTTSAQCGLGGTCDSFTCKTNLWDVKTTQTPAVTVIDIGSNKVVASVPLNAELDKLFAATNVPDTSARRYPLHVVDIAFVPGTLTAYLPAKGADAVYRLDFNAAYDTKALESVGSADRPFIPLDLGSLDSAKQGKMPTAIAVAHGAKLGAPNRFAFVLNEATRNVTVLDLTADNIAGLPDAAAVAATSAMPATPAEEATLEGQRLFETGLGRWSLKGQAWGACATCHWDGLSDQVTWFHMRGARQAPSIDQTISKKNPGQLRIMNWTAHADELEDHEAGALRSTLGGVGAIVKSFDLTTDARIAFETFGQGGLNGSTAAAADSLSSSAQVVEVCVLDDWKKIGAYEATLRTPRPPSTLDAAKVAAGRAIFEEGKCQGCHGGDQWTIARRFYTPDPDTASATNINNALRARSWTTAVTSAAFPTNLLPTTIPASQTMRYNGTNSSFDALTCALRPVGTFGVAEPGVGVAELRRNMSSISQGNEASGRGFNVPSLLGMSVGAPYFHAGNARTLEALLSETFAAHHGAINAAFLGPADTNAEARRAALVEFLLSVDADTPPVAIPPLGPEGGSFCSAQ